MAAVLIAGVICAFSQPALAAGISGPSISSGTYTLSWSNPNRAELQERPQGGTFTTIYDGYGSSQSFTKSTDGVFEYRVRGCIPPEPGYPETCYPWSELHQVTVEHVPTMPGSLGPDRESTTGAYTLSWGASQGSNIDYELHERSPDGVWRSIATTSATARFLGGRTDGVYEYRVRACNRGGCSSFTAITSVTVLKIPTVPSSLAVPASSTTGVFALTWFPSLETVDYYEVERSQDGEPFLRLGYPISPWVDFAAHEDGHFEYRVRACNHSGCSGYSATVATDVLKIPAVPSSLSVPPVSHSGRYTVAWTAPLNSTVARYELETSPDGISWQSRPVEAREVHERHIEPATLRYRVLACNASGCSDPTPVKTVVVEPRFPEIVEDAERIELSVPEGEDVGTVAGSAGVEGGAATYTIPIPVPPGRRGMQPAVALAYSSRAGNGILGVGWTLDAGSSIYRCPQTVAQDGQTRSVDFTAGDRLCLDGRRLILVAGSYGQTGSEYRTEIDSFARIRLLGGSMASASSYFRVERKAGRIEYHGAIDSQNAVHVPPGAPAPLAWKLRRVEDTQGNSVQYDYGPAADGHALTDIYFTGTGATAGDRRVHFSYDVDRPDVSQGYRAGVEMRSRLRLTDVRTYVGDALVHRYELAYRVSNATRRSLLDRVRACAREDCTGTDTTPWTELVYPTRTIAFNHVVLPDAADEYHDVRLVNDYDGDGTRDQIVLAYPEAWGGSPSQRLLYLSSRGTPIDLTDAPWFDAYDGAVSGYPSNRDTDFDRDGMADLVGRQNGMFTIASWDGSQMVPVTSNLPLASTAVVYEALDFDMDGDTDVLVGDAGNLVLHRNCTARNSATIAFCDSIQVTALGQNERLGRVVDFDGNALPDLYLDWSGFGERTPARIVFSHHAGSQLAFVDATIESLGGPTGSFGDHRGHGIGFFDANGDGLLDIYLLAGPLNPDPTRVWLNTSGAFERIAGLGAVDDIPGHLYDAVFPMDIDADGRDELMVPSDLAHEWCYQVLENEEWIDYCSDMFGISGAPTHRDRSIYYWDAVRFRFDTSGAATVERESTTLRVPVRASRVEDFHGDGLLDVRYRIANLYGATATGIRVLGRYKPSLPKGSYVARNVGTGYSDGRLPDLLLRVRDGLQRDHTWSYAPLSSDGVADCPTSAARPFYRVDRDSAAPHHYHFASSMRVVARFTEPNGVDGASATCYRYEDAMYSDEGRGFAGFRTIIAEKAYEEDPADNLRTTTHYHDAFPLTGRPQRILVHLASDAPSSPPLRETEMMWDAHCDGQVCWPYLSTRIESTHDLATRALLHTTTTIHTYEPEDLRHGNPSTIEVVTDDEFLTHVRRTELDYDYADASAWWIDKLATMTVIDEPIVYKNAPYPDAEDNAAKRVSTVLQWYPDTSPWRRLLQQETVQPGDPSQEKITYYEYDGYGNPDWQSVTAARLDAPRVGSSTYTADGYFVDTETNAAGHIRTVDYDPASGLLRSEEMYGITTSYQYDGLGRMYSTSKDGVPTLSIRRLWCDATCPPLARFRTVAVQDGAPVQWQYLDALERVIERRVTGFGGAAQIVTAVAYNERGQVVRESKPSHVAGGAYFTEYSGHDALGRPTRKDVDRTGHVHDTFTTLYEHDGATTHIELPGGLTAARTYNALGQLMETVDTGGQATRYRHDAHGNPILIEDSAGHRIRSRYDDVGRRVGMSDPDSGTWSFGYNGVGELIARTDANDDVLELRYDALGRLRQRLVNGALESEWRYDLTRPGVLDSEHAYSADQSAYSPGESADSTSESGTGVFVRTHVHDDLLRPIGVTTEVDGLRFVQEYAYDSYYGRLKGVRYPGGEVVALGYDAHGYQVEERDPLAPEADLVYRRTEDMTPRGQVAHEVFGNGLEGIYEHHASTGQIGRIQVVPISGSGAPVQDLGYAYEDAYGNLSRHESVATGVAERYVYDALQRLDSATRTWADGRAPVTIDYAYDALGNLTRKDDFALDYHYGTADRSNPAQAGPHAVSAVVRPGGTAVDDFVYDANGNMLEGNGRTLRYDAQGKPVEILEGGVTTRFRYGPDRARYKQETAERTVYSVGPDYEYIVTGGAVVEKSYVAGYLVIEQHADARRVRYLHKDRLGSVDTVTDEAGVVIERHGYDAFGKPLTSEWEDDGGLLHGGEFVAETTTRGFTGHEHLDAHGLIHMGGRAYDPALGRFVSVDPLIQDPSNSQSLNPYSYVLNNPLSGVDPTGYACEAIGDGLPCDPSEAGQAGTATAPDVGPNGQQGQGSESNPGAPAVEQGAPSGEGKLSLPDTMTVSRTNGESVYDFSFDGEASETAGPGTEQVGLLSTVIGDGLGLVSIPDIPVSPSFAKAAEGAMIVATAFSGAIGAVTTQLGRLASRTIARPLSSLASKVGNPLRGLWQRFTRSRNPGGNLRSAARGGDGFLVGPNGTATHRSQREMVESIESAGAKKIGPAGNTTEGGTIYRMDTPNGPMEVRVMEGRPGGGPYQDRRTVVTRPGTKEYVNPNGSRIEGAVPKAERRKIGHIHGQVE